MLISPCPPCPLWFMLFAFDFFFVPLSLVQYLSVLTFPLTPRDPVRIENLL